jgi:hypothetical protein
VAALLVAAVAAGGCDSLLEVDLPDAVTESALETPNTAPLQVNSIMALFECGYSSLALKAAGYEDNFQRVSGVAGLYSEYETIPAGGNCDSGAAYTSAWMNAMLQARSTGYAAYDRISAWTDAEVPNRQRLLAKAALYTALPLGVFGEFFCEMAVDAGPLMTPEQTLDLALSWVDKANNHIAQSGDFAVTVTAGTISPSIQTMTNGLRARLLWAKGDLAAAATEAAKVQNGFVAWVLREEGEDRRNIVAAFQGGAQQAAGFLQGPVRLRTQGLPYGVTYLGNNPVTGQPWPNPVPFTGYLDLAIDAATGRAVSDAGYPLTTDVAGTVPDTRVQHRIGNTAGGPLPIVNKYSQNTDDIHLINWKEMRLIQAQYQNEVVNSQAAAIALINELRTADNLPIIQGAYAAGATQASVRDMIIEERRRALWLEGRFWSTKIQNPDKLWFPRNEGDWTNSAQYKLNGGVRVMLPENEYQINPNLTLEMRGTGCAPAQAPVFN